jgi:hypothetical protein
VTLKAPETAYRHLEVAAINAYRFPVEQGFGDLPAGCIQYPGEGTPGNTHLRGALLLFLPVEVFKAYRFGFFHEKPDLFKLGHSHPGGLEKGYRRYGADLPPKLPSSHVITFLYCTYAHYL